MKLRILFFGMILSFFVTLHAQQPIELDYQTTQSLYQYYDQSNYDMHQQEPDEFDDSYILFHDFVAKKIQFKRMCKGNGKDIRQIAIIGTIVNEGNIDFISQTNKVFCRLVEIHRDKSGNTHFVRVVKSKKIKKLKVGESLRIVYQRNWSPSRQRNESISYLLAIGDNDFTVDTDWDDTNDSIEVSSSGIDALFGPKY